MGLEFEQADASWSYSGFSSFRYRLAEKIGMDLDEMEGFYGKRPFSDYDDPIIPLLDHSDCEGFISVEDCKRVAPRLRELIGDWDENDYDRQQAEMLANGMDDCVKDNTPLEFC
jgi:hypothetical protein